MHPTLVVGELHTLAGTQRSTTGYSPNRGCDDSIGDATSLRYNVCHP
jgi:hypothetical protein